MASSYNFFKTKPSQIPKLLKCDSLQNNALTQLGQINFRINVTFFLENEFSRIINVLSEKEM